MSLAAALKLYPTCSLVWEDTDLLILDNEHHLLLYPCRWAVQFCDAFPTPTLLHLSSETLNKKLKAFSSTSTHNCTAAEDTNPILGEIIITIHLKMYRPHGQRRNLKVVCSIWRNLQFSLAREYDGNEVPKAQRLKTPRKTRLTRSSRLSL